MLPFLKKRGVMQQKHLLSLIRQQFKMLLNNYIQMPQLDEKLEDFISAPQLGEHVGLYGGLALAVQSGLSV